jgi:hypothetical protein
VGILLSQQRLQEVGYCLCLLQLCTAGHCPHQRLTTHVPAADELLHLLGQQAELGLQAQLVAELLHSRRQALVRSRGRSRRRGGGVRHPPAAEMRMGLCKVLNPSPSRTRTKSSAQLEEIADPRVMP